MKQNFKELYGIGILFFYFFKWPYFLGFPILYENGLDNNVILDGIWLLTILLILKDFYAMWKNKSFKV